MIKRVLYNLANFILRHPVKVFVVSLILTLIMGVFITRLRLESDMTALLPDHFESVKGLHHLQEEFGSGGLLIAIVKGPYEETTRFADEFAGRLERLEDVRYVDWQRPVEFFEKNGMLYISTDDLNEVLHRIKNAKIEMGKGASPIFNELFSLYEEGEDPFDFSDITDKYINKERFAETVSDRYYVSPDKSMLAMIIKPNVNFYDLRAVTNFLNKARSLGQKTIDSMGLAGSLKLDFTGDLSVAIESNKRIIRDVTVVSLIIFLALVLTILIYYRRLLSLVLIGLPLGMGLVWSMACTYLFIGNINLVTSFSSGVLMGLGSDYGIYILSRFLQEREKGNDFQSAFLRTYTNTSRALLSACITTIATFALLIIPDFRGFSELGLIGCMGITFNLLMMFSVLPSLLVIFSKKGWLHERAWIRPRLPIRIGVSSGTKRLARSIQICVAFVLLGVISLAVSTDRWRLEYNLDQLMNYNPPLNAITLEKEVEAALGGHYNPTIVMAKNEAEEKLIVEALTERIKNQSERIIKEVVSLTSFVPEDQDEKISIISQIKKEVSTLSDLIKKKIGIFASADVKPFGREDIPNEVRRLFLSQKPNSDYRAILVHTAIKRNNTEAIEKFAAAVKNLPSSNGHGISASGEYLVLADIFHLIKKDAVWLMVAALILIWFVLWIDFRSITQSFGIFFSMTVGLALMLGCMRLLGVYFNILNIALVPVIVGTGIDSFIHYHHRYLEDKNSSPWRSLRVIGPAITVSCLTTLVGFGGFILIGNEGLKTIGLLAIAGIFSTYMSSVLLYPSWLTIHKYMVERRAERERQRIARQRVYVGADK